ncbi:hypothetical protein BC833DRAFT_643984 [Globomyces pollinis-pini]|nr:hypothetical protein BC833DRAFT_643984 [Globomyces pollinis-pini]
MLKTIKLKVKISFVTKYENDTAISIVKRVKKRPPTKSVLELQNAFVNERLKYSPMEGSLFHYPMDQDGLYDDSNEALDCYLLQIDAIEKELNILDISILTKQEYLDFGSFQLALKIEKESYAYHELSVLPDGGNFGNLVKFLQSHQPLRNEEDLRKFTARLNGVSAAVNSSIKLLKQGVERKITLNEPTVDNFLIFLNQLAQSNISKYGNELGKTTAFDVIILDVNPALDKLSHFLNTVYRANCRASWGIYDLPNSKKVYQDMICVYTSTNHTAEQLHEMGLKEVERIKARMEEVKDLIYEGTLSDFQKDLNDIEKFRECRLPRHEVIPFIERLLKEIEEKLPELFYSFPKSKLQVKAVEQRLEDNSPMTSYNITTTEILVNLKLCDNQPIYILTSMVLREINPIQSNVELRKRNSKSDLAQHISLAKSYVNGWGLYCEYLGEEMGMYKHPLALYGRLEHEMQSAIDLVVDTGIHYYNWDRQKAIEIMHNHNIGRLADLESEVNRYSSFPGQSLRFKVGELKLLELRKHAETTLEHLFCVKEFHQIILDNGPITLEILELRVREWVTSKLAQPSTLLDLQNAFVYNRMKESPLMGDLEKYPFFRDKMESSSILAHEGSIKQLELQLDNLADFQAVFLMEKDKTVEALKGQLRNLILSKSTDLEIPITQMYGSVIGYPQAFEGYQRMESTNDFLNYKSRLNQIPDMIEEGMITENPADSPFNFHRRWTSLGIKEDALLKTITNLVNPAILLLKNYISSEYLPHARPNPGLFGIPNHRSIYENFSKYHTTTSYSSEDLHNIGLSEVERIAGRMEEVKNQVFEGTFEEFKVSLANKQLYPQLYVSDRDEIIPYYEKIMMEINQILPQYFNHLPKTVCEIHAVPVALEASMPMGYYMGGNEDVPGKFMVNLSLCQDKPLQQATALILHEAMPGHHLQSSLVQEKDQHLSASFSFYTAYVEGWGLYAEYLGEEMGLYRDPLALYGRLEYEMHRALRLVVDTGLHIKGWTIDECVALLEKHLTMTKDEVLSEVKRYCAMPGQALAYKIGEMKIRELRASAERELGDKFQIKDFHDLVLDSGVPMDVLEVKVNNWISSLL